MIGVGSVQVSPAGVLGLAYLGVSLGCVLLAIRVYRRYEGIGVPAYYALIAMTGVVIGAAGTYFLAVSFALDVGSIQNMESMSSKVSGLALPSKLTLFALNVFHLALGSVFVPALYLLFVFVYTSRTERSEREFLPLIGVPIAVVSVVVNGLWWAGQRGFLDLRAPLQSGFSILVFLLYIAGAASVFVGIGQLFRTVRSYEYFPRALTLALGLTVPAYYFGFHILRFSIEDPLANFAIPLPFAFLSLGAFWLAVEKCDMFDELPAAYAVARDDAVDAFDDPVVILDRRRRVIDTNPAVDDLVRDGDPTGEPIATVLPDGVDVAPIFSRGDVEVDLPDRDRVFEVHASEITDAGDRSLGWILIFNDVTTARRREQRIQVLNRVLRHNLRNEGNVVKGYADLLAEDAVEADEYAPVIASEINDLVEMGERARRIESVLAADRFGDAPVSLATVVENAIEAVRPVPDAVSITTSIPAELDVRVNPTILQPVVEELVTNAIEHNTDEFPAVNVMVRDDGSSLVVADNGPGIPAHETEVVEAGEETPLEHASGLGLWLVRWGVDRIGGTLSFETDSGGSRVVIEFPDSAFASVTSERVVA